LPPCPITINSPFIGIFVEYGITTVTISGSVNPGSCWDLQVNFGYNLSGQPTIDSQTGNWTITKQTKFHCNDLITVTASCPSLGCSITLTGPIICSCCPRFSDLSCFPLLGGCVAGRRLFCLTATVFVPRGCNVQVMWVFGDGSQGPLHPLPIDNNTGMSYTVTDCNPYIAPGNYLAHLVVVSPTSCPPSPDVPVNVPPCDCCPDVSVTSCIPDCDEYGNREITFAINVTAKPSPCPDVKFVWDLDDGTPTSTTTVLAGTQYSYTVTTTYSGTSDHTPSLTIQQPQGCLGWSKLIPKCCKTNTMLSCQILHFFMAFILAVGLSLLLLSFSGLTIVSNFIWGAIGVFIVLSVIFLWIIGCPKCLCGWFYRLLWRVLFGVGWLYAIFSNCFSFWSFLIGLGIATLGIVFLLLWKKKCCVKLCPFLFEIFGWISIILVPLTIIIHAFIWYCLSIFFELVLVGIWLLVFAYWILKQC
jgi:hypothetical protein